MEILYKQTALFPLSSCRDRARVTFFIDRLKHAAVPDPHPERVCYQPTHASRAHGTAVGAGAAHSGRAGIPTPEPLSKAGISTAHCSSAGGFVQVREARREEKAYDFVFVPLRLPTDLLDACEVPGTFLIYQIEKLHSDDTGRR